ncbi:MAG: hydrogenase maturation protease [Richelia sp. RM2_1_2]|nr:hydrogenase maturation protease [Richelia sp. SM1_7_0]NJN10472.1 hydrogenase maturation protease [Richelia sp. RM1_1_1]NJO26385.1 hydrogenase maturation protease [Richelia sp. SL_2_1]NJO57632.1 hydrogenase maturation protease [Richelia sp. RM2_1_2]
MSKENNNQKILLIGIGNKFSQDDAVGLVVAEKFRNQLPPEIKIIQASGEGVALMELWQDATTVYLFDAVMSGAEVGKIHRIDVQVQTVPAKFFNYSTHAFSVAEAVELARTLNQLPPKLIIYGVEGKNFAYGIGLSPEIEQATEDVVQQVLVELCNGLSH